MIGVAKRFQAEERRHVYTTPKSFLELLKLYQVLLEHKREDSEHSIQRLKSGLKKMQETSDAVTEIEATLKVTLEDAEIKKNKAEGIAEVVGKEKAYVESETAAAETIALSSSETLSQTLVETQMHSGMIRWLVIE